MPENIFSSVFNKPFKDNLKETWDKYGVPAMLLTGGAGLAGGLSAARGRGGKYKGETAAQRRKRILLGALGPAAAMGAGLAGLGVATSLDKSPTGTEAINIDKNTLVTPGGKEISVEDALKHTDEGIFGRYGGSMLGTLGGGATGWGLNKSLPYAIDSSAHRLRTRDLRGNIDPLDFQYGLGNDIGAPRKSVFHDVLNASEQAGGGIKNKGFYAQNLVDSLHPDLQKRLSHVSDHANKIDHAIGGLVQDLKKGKVNPAQARFNFKLKLAHYGINPHDADIIFGSVLRDNPNTKLFKSLRGLNVNPGQLHPSNLHHNFSANLRRAADSHLHATKPKFYQKRNFGKTAPIAMAILGSMLGQKAHSAVDPLGSAGTGNILVDPVLNTAKNTWNNMAWENQ